MEDKWSAFWQHENEQGECFVDKDGNKHRALQYFWQEQLGDDKNLYILDVASGAGSIFKSSDKFNNNRLFAADISQQALQRLNKDVAAVHCIQALGHQLPFKADSFDFIVSQFGIEYAGLEAISQSFKYLRPGGRLTFLCHIRDGYIDSYNQAQLIAPKYCQDIQFIDVARETVKAAFGSVRKEQVDTLNAFMQVEPKLAAFKNSNPPGIHSHLYDGFKQLFLNRQHYQLQDILNWLQQMDMELNKITNRIAEMRRVAIDPDQIEIIVKELQSLGAVNVKTLEFQLPEHAKPMAWCISAQKGKS